MENQNSKANSKKTTLIRANGTLEKKCREAKKEETKMDIFICGEKFPENFKSNIFGMSDISTVNTEFFYYMNGQQNSISLETFKHPRLNWIYYFFKEEKLTEDKINQIYSIIHSNFISWKIENNVLVVVVEKINSEEVSNVIKILYTKMNEVERPKLIFVRKDQEDFNLKIDVDVDDEEDEFGPKSLAIFRCDEYEQIREYFFSICSYLNQFGDSVTFTYDMKRSQIQHKYPLDTLNILVIGDPASGKSTLINKILGKRRANTSNGSKNIVFYYHEEAPVVLFDTPGIEGNEDIPVIMDLLHKSNHIHVIFLVINFMILRLDKKKVEFLKAISTKIPIYILITNSKSRKSSKRGVEAFKSTMKQEFGEGHPLLNCVFGMELKSKENSFGMKELIEKMYFDSLLGQLHGNFEERSFINKFEKFFVSIYMKSE